MTFYTANFSIVGGDMPPACIGYQSPNYTLPTIFKHIRTYVTNPQEKKEVTVIGDFRLEFMVPIE